MGKSTAGTATASTATAAARGLSRREAVRLGGLALAGALGLPALGRLAAPAEALAAGRASMTLAQLDSWTATWNSWPYCLGVNLPSNTTLTKVVQMFCNDQNGAGLNVDGGYGSLTKQAVINLQRKYGLSADGVVGCGSWDRFASEERKLIQAGGSQQQPQQSSGYNAQAAANYALTHALDSDGELCAQFVARCLAAGGYPIDPRTSTGVSDVVRALVSWSYRTQINESPSVFERLAPKSGVTVRRLVTDGSGRAPASSNCCRPGDLIAEFCCGCDDGAPWVHTSIVTSTSGGFVQISQHNTNRRNVTYYAYDCAYCGSSNVVHYLFHIE